MRSWHSLLFSLVLCAPAMGQQPDSVRRMEPVGCYRTTPALTYSAWGQPERGDTSWAVLRLLADGRASRPLLRYSHDRNSRWGWRADTLIVVVHDGLVGWSALLVRTDSAWAGKARYLTDVIGGEPLIRPLRIERRSCEGLPNGELYLTAPFRTRSARFAR